MRQKYLTIFNPLNAELRPICHLLILLGDLTFMGYVRRKYIQQDAASHSLFISGNCSTCFGWYFHPSSGAHTTVSTPSGICNTVTAICRYRGRVGTGLSVLWVAYATHSTLNRPSSVQPKMTARKLRCGVNWQGMLKRKKGGRKAGLW
jgi:hypothetical protein